MLTKIYRCIVSTICTNLADAQATCFCSIDNLFVDTIAGFMGVLKIFQQPTFNTLDLYWTVRGYSWALPEFDAFEQTEKYGVCFSSVAKHSWF